MWFDGLVKILNDFQLVESPYREALIESQLMNWLKDHHVGARNQRNSSLGRYDIVLFYEGHRVCLELKKRASTSCVEQIDRYSRDFEALILVCYRASSTLKGIFEIAKKSAKIPIEIIEIRSNCELA